MEQPERDLPHANHVEASSTELSSSKGDKQCQKTERAGAPGQPWTGKRLVLPESAQEAVEEYLRVRVQTMMG